MARAKRYSTEQVGNARKTLRGLSSKKVGKSRAEVAGMLAQEIRQAVERGYSLKEIRDVLVQAGVSIPLTRLQAVLDGEKEKDSLPPGNEPEQGLESSGESPPERHQVVESQEIPSKGDWTDDL